MRGSWLLAAAVATAGLALAAPSLGARTAVLTPGNVYAALRRVRAKPLDFTGPGPTVIRVSIDPGPPPEVDWAVWGAYDLNMVSYLVLPSAAQAKSVVKLMAGSEGAHRPRGFTGDAVAFDTALTGARAALCGVLDSTRPKRCGGTIVVVRSGFVVVVGGTFERNTTIGDENESARFARQGLAYLAALERRIRMSA